jgi:hypothetical protein
VLVTASVAPLAIVVVGESVTDPELVSVRAR